MFPKTLIHFEQIRAYTFKKKNLCVYTIPKHIDGHMNTVQKLQYQYTFERYMQTVGIRLLYIIMVSGTASRNIEINMYAAHVIRVCSIDLLVISILYIYKDGGGAGVNRIEKTPYTYIYLFRKSGDDIIVGGHGWSKRAEWCFSLPYTYI